MVLGSGIRIRDPGSGKNPFRIPDPGVKKAPDPQHCLQDRKYRYLLVPVCTGIVLVDLCINREYSKKKIILYKKFKQFEDPFTYVLYIVQKHVNQ
jgi:hypothetical protein